MDREKFCKFRFFFFFAYFNCHIKEKERRKSMLLILIPTKDNLFLKNESLFNKIYFIVRLEALLIFQKLSDIHPTLFNLKYEIK